MKAKIKLTVREYQYLVNFIFCSTYTGLTELQMVNIRLFRNATLKKLIDWEKLFYDKKPKTLNIDINQFTAIMALLNREYNNLDPYALSIFVALQNQNKNLLTIN